MADQATLEVLAHADAAAKLPRLGGMARPNGVVIVSEHFWAFAGTDGSLREGTMPPAPRALRRIPLLRGLVRLGAALSPIARGQGVVGGRERAFLAAILVASFGFFVLPPRAELAAGIALSAVMIGWILRGRTLHLHGAEHRAIRAVEDRQLVAAWAGDVAPSRFASRCGTNFAALVLPVAAFGERTWPLPAAAVAVLSLALTMELWLAIEGSRRRVARLFLAPGLALQRLTTREPTLDETRVALRAAASVLRRELDWRHPVAPQLVELREDQPRVRALALECFDPQESRRDVHATNVARNACRVWAGSVPVVCQLALAAK